MKERILVIDDDQAFADSLRFALRKEFDVEVATNRREAREQLLFKVDAVLLDINFSGELSSGDTSGFAILEELREEFLLLPVVMLSGYEDPAIVIDAFRKGASDYIIKARMDIRELKVLLRRHLDKIRRVRASVGVAEEIKFIGNSGTTRLLKEEIARIAVFDTTVLLNGETGVGKEVAARYLHHLSHRARHPFVAVNLASLSPTVVEAELFGSVKGAFTGATTDRKGYFEVAHKGTLFLDEIGDLTHEVQVKLLRFLEDKSVCPVGSTKPVVVDTRLVCATHKNLQEEVKQGRFREDLYFRINVYNLDSSVAPEERGFGGIDLLFYQPLRPTNGRAAPANGRGSDGSFEWLPLAGKYQGIAQCGGSGVDSGGNGSFAAGGGQASSGGYPGQWTAGCGSPD